MTKILKALEQRLLAVAQRLGALLLPIRVRKIDADGNETTLREVADPTAPHVKATIRYVRPIPRRDDGGEE